MVKVINIGYSEMFRGTQKPSGPNPGQQSLDGLTWIEVGFEQDDLNDVPALTYSVNEAMT